MRRIRAEFEDTEKLSRYLRELGCTEAQIERHVALKGRHKLGCLELTSTRAYRTTKLVKRCLLRNGLTETCRRSLSSLAMRDTNDLIVKAHFG